MKLLDVPGNTMIYNDIEFQFGAEIHIVIELFTGANIAELCRRHGLSVVQFHKWN